MWKGCRGVMLHVCTAPTASAAASPPYKYNSPCMGAVRGNHQAVYIHILIDRHHNELHRSVGSCNHSEDMLGIPMSPASSSTLIHEVLRLRDRQ